MVFGGGSSEQLLSASDCPRTSAAFWATTDGNFVVYVPGTNVSSVNREWSTLFSNGIPNGTPLVAKCQ